MKQRISMSGDETEITNEYHCEKCGTYAKLIWNPGRRIKHKYEGIEF